MFSKNKGHEYFLNEARLIKQTFKNKADIFKKKDLKFLIIGGSVFRDDACREKELRELTDRLGLRDSVIFCGLRNDMPQIFNVLDVLVLTSDAEACGRVLIEAMASGRPIVATNTGGTPELVPDGVAGILIPVHKPKALSDAVMQLLKDNKRMHEMGLAGRKWAERNFSIEENVKRIEQVYKELLKSRKHRGST